MGLNMYDVMSWRRGRGRDEAEEWSPERHRTIDGAEVVEMRAGARRRASPPAATSSTTARRTTSRLVLTVLGEAERFGAVIANRCEVTGLVERDGRAAGVLVRDGSGGGEFELCADNVVNATGVWADRIRPRGAVRARRRCRVIRPSRGTHITLPRELLDVRAGAIVPGRRRAHGVRAAVAGPDAGGHDRQRLRGLASSTCRPPTRTWRTCSRR